MTVPAVEYHLLKHFWPQGNASVCNESFYHGRSKLETLFGTKIWSTLANKTVIDFGCGEGSDSIGIASVAKYMIGLDIRESVLSVARQRAAAKGLDNCLFTTHLETKADVIISIDSFEHFDDPAAILEVMARHLNPDGTVLISFGPPWLHPYGGHLFSVFPWAHLLLTEKALIRWRSDFKNDRATRFSEVEGGLNQMTIQRFNNLIQASRFKILNLTCVPIRATRRFHNRFTKEFLTSTVRCSLGLR